MSITEFLDPGYVKGQLDRLNNLNITLSAHRDAILGVDNRSLTDVYNALYEATAAKTAAQLLNDILGKLDLLDNALASVATDKFRVSIVDPLPIGDNVIGRVKITDGTNLLGLISGDIGATATVSVPVVADLATQFAAGTAYTEQVVSVTTTAATSSFSPPLKLVNLCNEGDTDITLQLNGGTVNKTLSARACKSIAYWKISSITYSVAAGSSTLRIEGYW